MNGGAHKRPYKYANEGPSMLHPLSADDRNQQIPALSTAYTQRRGGNICIMLCMDVHNLHFYSYLNYKQLKLTVSNKNEIIII